MFNGVRLAVPLLAALAALACAAPVAASTWYVSGTITNETAYTAAFPEYETDCPGGAGVRSGNWIIAPPSAIPPGKSVPYKFDAPHFGEGAHMCLAYEILAGGDEERLQTWTITVDDAIAQSPWASCQPYYPIGDAGCVLGVSGANKNVTASFRFSDCGPPGTPCPGAEGECAAAKSQDTPELCQWFFERGHYPGLAGHVLGLGAGYNVVSALGYRGGVLRYSLSRPALVRVLVSKRTRSGLRPLPTRERLLGAGAQRTRLRLASGRYRLAAIACHAPKRCSTDVLRVTVP